MNYLRLLDEARGQLERGELLAAEDLVRRAREAWSRSRFRAPLVERGFEPVLRRAGKWLGRRSESPVLPVFGHRVARLEEDLGALAHLLRDEALDLARHDVATHGLREFDLLERALRLDRESRVFSLDRTQRWAVTRNYLQVGRRLACRIRPDLLPSDVAAPEDLGWLQEWSSAWLASGATGDAENLDWVHRQAVAAASLSTSPESARWWWIATKAALQDPLQGPRALEAVRRALEAGLDGPDRDRALRALGGLLVNERVLAGPGADVQAALRRHAFLAGDREWPDREVQALLRARRAEDDQVHLVGVSWSSSHREVVLVAHRGGQCADALVLRPGESPREGDPFAAAAAEARGWIHRWLPSRCVLVSETEPPSAVGTLLGDRPVLRMDALLDALAESSSQRAPEPPFVPHPLWSPGPVPEPWGPLVERARALVPALRHVLVESPAFSSGWGRENLRALAAHGLELCGALELAAGALLGDVPATEEGLQRVNVGVELAWLPLHRRPWLVDSHDRVGAGAASIAEEGVLGAEPGADVWFGRRATTAELAAVAIENRRSEVITAGADRARAIAASATTRTDPRGVTVAPARSRCAEPWLVLLERWIRDAVADPHRQLDVLWLWRAVSESAAGDPLSRPGRVLSPERLAEIDAAAESDHRCAPACRLVRDGECWAAQLAGRREQAVVWIVDLEQSLDSLDPVGCVVLDDPRTWVVRCRSEAAAARLDHALERVERAGRAWMWMDGGVLADTILEFWRRRSRSPRPLHRRPAPRLRENAVLWLAPPGYRPADPLLAEESARLTELRADALRRSGEAFTWWTPATGTEARASDSVVSGVADEPTAADVVCAELGGPSLHSELLLLLRAAAASSHARERCIVLDPRLAHLLGHAGGRWPGALDSANTDPALDSALQPGARLLGARHANAGAEWTHPLTASRLLYVASRAAWSPDFSSARAEAVAHALRESTRGRNAMIAAATDAERRLVIDTIRALAEASGDGGPLGARCVVVVGAPARWRPSDARARVLERVDDRTLGTVVLEVERGVVSRVDLGPEHLEDDGVIAWARRAGAIAWIVARGERDLDVDPLRGGAYGSVPDERGRARASRLADAIARAGSRAVVFVDAVSAACERSATVLRARVASVEPAPSARTWTIGATAPEVLTIACPHCEATMEVHDFLSVCPACSRRAWLRASGRSRLGSAFEDVLLRRLQQRAHARPTWAIDLDSDRAARMRARLGLQPWERDEAPLLHAAGDDSQNSSLAVLGLEELWDHEGPVPSAVQVLGRLRDAAALAAILARLDVLGSEDRRLELFLEPLGLDADPPIPGRARRWKWAAARAEVEFRLRARLQSAPTPGGHRQAGLGPLSWIPLVEDETTDALEALLDHARPAGLIESTAFSAMEELERAGLAFGAPVTAPLPASVVRAHSGFLSWASDEGLLDGEPAPRTALPLRTHGPLSLADLQWESALRSANATPAAALLDAYAAPSALTAEHEAASLPGTARRSGIAGSTTSTWLRACIEAARADGRRVLVIVPRAGSRARWSRVGPRAVDVVTAEEFALAFLRVACGVPGEPALRLLPPAGRADGEEVRLRLMRETSRRYAASAGAVPPIDAADLRRVVEDEPVVLRPLSDEFLDRNLLELCAERTRVEAGWLSARQLREQCRAALDRARNAGSAWSARYPYVAVEDAQDLHPDLLGFVREVFQASVRWETSDPLRAHATGDRFEDDVDLQSHTMPKEWVAAIEVLWRGAPALPGRPRTTRKGRDASRLHTVRVLTLDAVQEWIVAEIDPQRDPDRTAVVVAVEPDRNRLVRSLLASEYEVRLGDRLASWGASGPRQLLAALHLAEGTSRDESVRERLLACVLGPAFEAAERSAAAPLQRFDHALRHEGRPHGAHDPETARVLLLAALVPELRAAPDLRAAIETLVARGVFDGLLLDDGAVGRLREILEHHDGRDPREVLASVPAEFVSDPHGPSRALWLLGPDDLDAGTFDHVIHVCTGYEPPVRHYRALAASCERFTLLHSERDPLR